MLLILLLIVINIINNIQYHLEAFLNVMQVNCIKGTV